MAPSKTSPSTSCSLQVRPAATLLPTLPPRRWQTHPGRASASGPAARNRQHHAVISTQHLSQCSPPLAYLATLLSSSSFSKLKTVGTSFIENPGKALEMNVRGPVVEMNTSGPLVAMEFAADSANNDDDRDTKNKAALEAKNGDLTALLKFEADTKATYDRQHGQDVGCGDKGAPHASIKYHDENDELPTAIGIEAKNDGSYNSDFAGRGGARSRRRPLRQKCRAPVRR